MTRAADLAIRLVCFAVMAGAPWWLASQILWS